MESLRPLADVKFPRHGCVEGPGCTAVTEGGGGITVLVPTTYTGEEPLCTEKIAEDEEAADAPK